MTGNRLDTSDFTPGHIHVLECNGNKGVTIDASITTLSEVVIDATCSIKFSSASALEDVTVFTTSTSDRSIESPSYLRLGAIDDCDPAGAVQIVTYGGFIVASNLQVYSSQVIARGPISFSASASGVSGGSFISGETIDGTSETLMGNCPNDQGEVFEVDLFRMAG